MKAACMRSVLVLSILLACPGCNKAGRDTSADLIKALYMTSSNEEKEEFLLRQAEAHFNDHRYHDALHTAEYILESVNPASTKAKRLVSKAGRALGFFKRK